MRRLARFRADPKKVRVSIQREGDFFVSSVRSRDESAPYSSFHGKSKLARVAILRALRIAEGNIPGVDLSMGWTYDHPWKARGSWVES